MKKFLKKHNSIKKSGIFFIFLMMSISIMRFSVFTNEFPRDNNEFGKNNEDLEIVKDLQPSGIESLNVSVRDRDGFPVQGVNVYLYNASGLVDFQISDSMGNLFFSSLNNGTYTLNCTYQNYGHEEFLVKTNVNVDLNTSKAIMVTDLSLTSLDLELCDYDNFNNKITGATVEFLKKNSSGLYHICNQSSDIGGKVMLVWKNYSLSDANISVRVNYFGDRLINNSQSGLVSYLNYTFESRTNESISVNLNPIVGSTLNTDPGSIDVNYGDNFYIRVYYNETPANTHISAATVMYGCLENATINGFLTENINWYDLTMDSSDFGSPGNYTLNISASKIGYPDQNTLVPINVLVPTGPPGPFNTWFADVESPWDTDGYFTISWNTSISADNYTIYYSFIPNINGNASNFIYDQGLTNFSRTMSLPNGIYYLRVRSLNSNGFMWSMDELIVNISIGGAGGPPGPFNTWFTDVESPWDTDGYFTINWTNSLGADNYTIFFSSNPNIDGGAGDFIYVQDLIINSWLMNLSNGIYFIRVQSLNSTGFMWSMDELIVNISIGGAGGPPGPFNTWFADVESPWDTDGFFNISWSNSLGADNYTIYYSNNPNIDGNNVTDFIYDIGLTIYSYSMSLPDGIYFIRLRSQNSTGITWSMDELIVNISIGGSPNPPGPFNTMFSDVESPWDLDGVFTINWSNSLGADNYTIFYSSNPNIDGGGGDFIYDQDLINFSRTMSLPDGIYFIRLLSQNSTGITWSMDELIVNISIGSPPNPPGPFNTYFTDVESPWDTDGIFTINWTNSIGADNYTIFFSSNPNIDGGAGDFIYDQGLTIYSRVMNLTNGIYFIRLQSLNSTGFMWSMDELIVNISIGGAGGPPGPFNTWFSSVESPWDSDGIFTISWSSSSGADNYTIFYSSNPNIDGGAGDFIYDQDLINFSRTMSLPDGVYFIRLLSLNSTGFMWSMDELVVNISIGGPGSPPGPFNIWDDSGGPPDDDGSFDIYCNGSIGANNYSIYYWDSYIFAWNNSLWEWDNGIALPYFINNMTNGTWYFIVLAFNDYGNSTSINCISVWVEIFITGSPPGPFNIWDDSGGPPDDDGIFNIYCNGSIGANSYSIYYWDSYIFAWNNSLWEWDIGIALPYFINNMNNGTWYFIVLAFNGYGNSTSINCISVWVEIQQLPPSEEKGEDDGDKDKDEPLVILKIPFGNFHLILVGLTLIYIIYYQKRRISLK